MDSHRSGSCREQDPPAGGLLSGHRRRQDTKDGTSARQVGDVSAGGDQNRPQRPASASQGHEAVVVESKLWSA